MTNKIKWDLTTIYKSDRDLDNDLEKVENNLDKIEALKENIGKNITDILLLDVDTSRVLEKAYSYAHMKKDEDANVTKYQKIDKKVMNLYNKYITKMSFLVPYLISLPEEKANEIKSDEKLKDFDVALMKVFRKREHTLFDKEEKVISTLSSSRETASNMYYYLTNVDMKFPYLEKWDKQITNVNFTNIQTDEDRELREISFKEYYNAYNQFGNTIAQSYYSHVDAAVKISQIRNYDNVRKMFLFNDDVDEKVYDTLIDSVHEYLPSLHKYYEIKKRELGLDEQHMYDVYMSISPEFEKKYKWEEAKDLVIESVKPLGEEYVEIYKKAFVEKWIDAEIREGKRGGAYSSGSYDTKPFILMNFDGTLNSLFTLAHEMGHSLHSYYDRNNNSYLHSGYTIFVAEVASTFNEALLLNLLLDKAENDKEKIYLIDFYINSYKSTVFRQTMFAEFERDAHKKIESGEVLTKEDFSKLYLELNKKYFGKAMISDEEIAYEWMRIPHFYSNFYVYKYATGFAASSILAKRILDGEEGAREKYMEFLKDGAKHFPIEQLKIAGVDMSNPETVNQSLEIFENLVKTLENMLNKGE
ncbi:oligoendopeptidase F [Helcococcus sueciensis]|uniref:oligoendopeptidase F n=1 Tax=Helcococcus sueciensis TaxID=241555 RepID=UPI00042357B0|nr:oligoendopeptidase F [Helcococcus sueciensis]